MEATKKRFTIVFELDGELMKRNADAFSLGDILNKDLTLLIPGDEYTRVVPAACIRSITEERI